MRTTRGLERLLTFVDAIVAIAITLLVLPLVDQVATGPEIRPGSAHPFGVAPDQIGAFLLSFVVIARLWTAHHSMFERVRAYDRGLLLWTLGWTLTIVFLPFPTELVARTSDDPAVRELYVGTMALSSICLSALAILIARRPALRSPDRSPERSPDRSPRYTTEAPLGSSLLFLVAMALTPIPRISYYALLVLLLEGPLLRLLRRAR